MPHCFARNLLPHALLLLSLAHPMAGATGSGPAVGTTTQSPATVTAASSVWITATATSPGSLSGVSLVYDAGSGPVTVAMYDDGVHQDFAAGDGVYGAQIPALAAGTIVKYYVTATNAAGLSATDPGIVPSYEYSYTVQASQNVPIVNAVTGGAFVMGDHFNTVDPDHPSDEIPLHTVTVSSFSIGKFDVTNEQYCNYLNSAYSQGIIHVTSGLVYGPDPATILSETRQGQVALYGIAYSGITWNGAIFSVLAGFQNMPVVGVRWEGALAYCNWLSALQGRQACYNLTTWACDFTKNGYRLPTEAEWEYAATGGNTNPYYMYAWGNDGNSDGSHANTLASGQPWATSTQINQAGAVYPWCTPVGFYDGTLHLRTSYNWPGSAASYQTSNAVNNYGLYDVAGNVWQWTNDWYAAGYYNVSATLNPTGPTTGDLMPDGKQHHTLRGGSYAQDPTDARITNRDPDFYRQPLNNTYGSIGFRVLLANGSSSPAGAGGTATALQIKALLANPATFSATADYPTQTLGVLTNATNAAPGYTLIDPEHGRTTYLIDNTGQVVHAWTSSYVPGLASFVLPNGHLIRAGNLGAQAPINTGGGEGGIIEERDWDGNPVWSFKYAGYNADGTGYEQHHDFVVMPNGNILMIVVEQKTIAAALAAGFNPSLFDANLAAGQDLQVDSLVEVQPSGTGSGTVVWQWHIWDHLIQNFDSTKSNYGVVANHPELLNANGGQHTIQFYNHLNGIDYNATLDQILITCRNQCEIWIIDHSTTTAQAASHSGGTHNKGGDFLYRWGNPSIYGAPGAAMMFQGHGAHWIPTGYPGAGGILFFNNGEQRPGGNYSSADEFTPPVDANGDYPLSTGAAWGPAKLSWTWAATPPLSFYNSDGGSAVRLPNGNTLIDYGNKGEVWEVTSSGQVVWDYQNCAFFGAALYQGDSLPADPNQAGGYQTCLWHAARYPSSNAAFTGRTLKQSGTIEPYRGIIELYNSGASAVSLSGMYLTNNLGKPTLWQVGAGVSIAAGGTVLIYADGQTSATTAAGRHASFTLNPAGGSIGLYAADGVTQMAVVTYGAQAADAWYFNGAPVISAQPAAATSAVGGSVTLAVTATGTSPLTYQWYLGGTAISGATGAALTLSNVQAANAGNYTVVATDAVGSVTSAVATLTVVSATNVPVFSLQPASVTIASGATAVFTAAALSTPAPTYQWFWNGTAISGATGATLQISGAAPSNVGTYTCVATNSGGSASSSSATLTITTNPGRLINLSVLALDGPGSQLLTVGFVTGGSGTSGSQTLLIRATGPALAALGVSNVLADPALSVLNAQTAVASNDNWGSNQAAVSAADAATGAFPLTNAASLDAALVATLPANSGYTVQVAGKANGTGNVLAEVYDDTPPGMYTAATPRLINLSCLQQVAAKGILTAGFVVGGTTPKTILIRATGPALAALGVTGTMPDPTLSVFSGPTTLVTNAGWSGNPQITAADSSVGAFGLTNPASADAAVLLALAPGSYTVQAKSASGAAGITLIEVYEVP